MLGLLYFIAFLSLLSVGLASLSLATWVPTRKKDLPRIFALANLRPNEKFYDLGCGDGKVVFYGARASQGAFVGLEIAWPFYMICQLRRFWVKDRRVTIRLKNLFREDLSGADVIYLFAGSPEKFTGKLLTKLKNELKPGARVLSYVFPINAWVPIKIDKPKETDAAIYLYQI